MSFFKKLWEWLKRIVEAANAITTTTTTTTTSGSGSSGSGGSGGSGGWPLKCGCDLSKEICEPEKGEECPVPWGLDIRFRGWSPSNSDTIFIGFNEGSVTKEGNEITGHCFIKNGKRYHYKGYRAPSSSSPLVEKQTGTYKTTYRMDYEARLV